MLVDYIKNELNTGSIQVDVAFSDSIVVEKEELKFEIMNPKFSVYYVPETDKLPPVSHKFFLTQDSSITLDNAESFSGNTFHKEEIASRPDGLSDSAYKEKLLQNMCNDVVYIYGRYSDDGSGVKSVVVNEVMTNDFYGYRCYRVDYVAKEYKEGSDNIIFRTVNNETTFLIKHVLTYQQSEDEFYYGGAYSLEIIVNDYCYNNTEPEKFTVINNRKIQFEENYADFSQLPIDISDWVDYEQYKASYISFLNSYYLYFLYSDFTLYNKVGYDKDDLTIKLQYFDSKKQLQSVTPSFVYGHYCVEDYGPDEQYFWDCYKMTFNAADLTIWPDTSMKIVVENKFGATYEDSLATFPVDNTELFFEVYEENNIKKIRVYDKDGMGQSGFRLIRTNKQDHTVQCSTKHEIEEGYDYQVMFGNVINSRVRFTGDNISLDDTIDEIVIEHFEIKKSREGYLVANITLNENVWSYYDNITYEDTYWHRCESVPKGSNSFSKEFEQSKIYENPYTTEQTPYNICTIYGYRNNLRTNGTPCEISKVSRTDASLVDKKKYDCEAPFFMFNMKGNEVELIMEDQFSGIDTGKIEAKGKTYLFNSETTSYTTPLSELISSKDDYSLIHFYGKDIAGNVRDEYINSYTFIKPLYGRIIKDDNHTSAVTMKLDVGVSTEKCYVYDFKVKEDGTVIGFPTEYKDSDATIVYTKEFNEQTNAWDIGVIEKTQFQNNNTYYKIVWKYQRYMGSVTSYPFNVFTNSIYCYSGTPGSGENDFLIPNGNSKKSVVINSDKPVFVHTVATSVPLKECRNWDLTEWEYYKEECGERILDFSSTSSPKVYNIPEIEKGKCYVVIAHYSDNHVLMSDIMVK